MKNKERLFIVVLCFVLFLSIALNSVIFLGFYNLSRSIEEYYGRDFLKIEKILDDLSTDIKDMYNVKVPSVTEIHILLGEYSQGGIVYNGQNLKLLIHKKVINFDEKKLRAFLAHDLMHFVLGHLQNSSYFSHSSLMLKKRNINLEIEADTATLRLLDRETLILLVEEIVWDVEEKAKRLENLKKTKTVFN